MSRLRTIKPGFFLDDELAACRPLTRILFAGLWTIADREGRLEDRPRRIKVEVLPYDECDVDELLGELSEHGFIVRYEVDGARFIAIPTWQKHQSPHVKEQASTIPAPDSPGACTMQTPYEPPSSCLGSCLGSGVLEPEEHGERGEHSLSTRNGAFRDAHDQDEFESWWVAFGRVGTKKARTADLYRWWLKNGATSDELMRAAQAYRAYCGSTGTISMHATTFLAKPSAGKSPIWPEWADGEAHGSMDVRDEQRTAEVLTTSMDAFAGVLGGSNGRHRYPGNGRGTQRAAGGGQDAGRGLPAGELAHPD